MGDPTERRLFGILNNDLVLFWCEWVDGQRRDTLIMCKNTRMCGRLHEIVRLGNVGTALIGIGCNVNAVDEEERTPLHVAAASGRALALINLGCHLGSRRWS